MLELIGELQVDLREMVQRGKVPGLSEWQSLRCEGRKTGRIRMRLVYLDASEDDKRRVEAAKATVTQRQQQRQQLERQQSDDGRARMQQLDFRVW